MARYLSREWIEELNEVATSMAPAGAAAASLRLQQVVTGGPDGDVAYGIELGDTIGVEAGPMADPDVTITEDYATAVAVGRGELSAQDALLAGRVHVRGDIGTLLRASESLAALRPAFDDVRARTAF